MWWINTHSDCGTPLDKIGRCPKCDFIVDMQSISMRQDRDVTNSNLYYSGLGHVEQVITVVLRHGFRGMVFNGQVVNRLEDDTEETLWGRWHQQTQQGTS